MSVPIVDDRPLPDPFNKFGLGSNGTGGVVFLAPVPRILSEDDALLLAAWLVAIVGEHERFTRILAAVEAT